MVESPDEESNPLLGDEIREVVENQVKDGTPPEAAETLKRLIRAGYTREQAVDKIAVAVVQELMDVLKSRQPYNEKRYVGRLNDLK